MCPGLFCLLLLLLLLLLLFFLLFLFSSILLGVQTLGHGTSKRSRRIPAICTCMYQIKFWKVINISHLHITCYLCIYNSVFLLSIHDSVYRQKVQFASKLGVQFALKLGLFFYIYRYRMLQHSLHLYSMVYTYERRLCYTLSHTHTYPRCR